MCFFISYFTFLWFLTDYSKFHPYVNGKTEYEKYVGQEYPTYKEDLSK